MPKLPPPLPDARRAPVGRYVLRGVLLLLVFSLLWYGAARVQDNRVSNRMEAAARRDGKPFSLGDLAAMYPPVPDAQNAAIPLLDAWQSDEPEFWTAFRRGERPLPERSSVTFDPNVPFVSGQLYPGEHLSDDTQAAIQKFLQTRSHRIEALRLAIQRQHCRFPIVIEEGLNALLPHLNELKIEAQTLRLLMLQAAARSDTAQAIATFENLVQLGDLLQAEPLTISHLVRAAIFELALSGIEDLMSRVPLTADEIREISDLARRIDSKQMAKFALEVERAASLSIFDMSSAGFSEMMASDSTPADQWGEANGYRLLKGFAQMTGVTASDRRLMIEATSARLQIIEQEWPAALRESEALTLRISERVYGFPPKLFSALVLPSAGRIVERFARLDAKQHAVLTALAIELYASRHGGALPQTLDALVPEIVSVLPRDSFDGGTLRYLRTDTNYLIYSVGPDLQDDGGALRRQSYPPKRDIGAEIKRPR